MDSGGRQLLLWTPAPLAPAKEVTEVWLLTPTPSVSHWALSNLSEGVIFVEPSTLYNQSIFVLDKVCWTKFSDIILEFKRLQPGGDEETKSQVQPLLKPIRFTQTKPCYHD